MRYASAIACALATTLVPFFACSDGATSSITPDAEADNAARGDAETDGGVAEADAGPIFNADGWVRVDFDPDCSFWAPPSAEKMPEPIAWEPCASTAASLGIACRQVKFPDAQGSGYASPAAWVDDSGHAWLFSARASASMAVEFVAEADGPVHQAIAYPRTGTCNLTNASLNGKKAIFGALRAAAKGDTDHRGAIGGNLDAVPVVLESWSDGVGRGYIAGPNSYFALGPENAVRPWAPGAPPLGTVSVTDPGQMTDLGFVGDDLFFQISTLEYSRIKVYSPAAGARDLVSFGNDVSANALDFGTDGVDMVWVEAFDRSSGTEDFKTINIVTSKFTSDATLIVKRRLRSENSTVGASRFVAGCGYGARYYSRLGGNGVRVVRLSDGWSWSLPEILPDGGAYWFPMDPIAITCDELFLNINDNGTFHPARIRLDSLGAGEAPD